MRRGTGKRPGTTQRHYFLDKGKSVAGLSRPQAPFYLRESKQQPGFVLFFKAPPVKQKSRVQPEGLGGFYRPVAGGRRQLTSAVLWALVAQLLANPRLDLLNQSTQGGRAGGWLVELVGWVPC